MATTDDGRGEPGGMVLAVPANWSRRGLARGGQLILTDRSLVFRPHAVERAIGLGEADWPRANIALVSVAPRVWWPPFSGGLRRRLRVTLHDGSELFFVVADAPSLCEQLARELR